MMYALDECIIAWGWASLICGPDTWLLTWWTSLWCVHFLLSGKQPSGQWSAMKKCSWI
jgi:hypothetical protein